jgi:AraC-like DNA-binding protein
MQHLVCVVSDPLIRSALTLPLQARVPLEICPDRQSVLELLRRAGVAAVLTELRDAQGHAADAFIATLRANFPAVPVIGVGRLRAGDAREIVAAARAGIQDVVFVDYEDPWAVVRRFVNEPSIDGAIAAAVAALTAHVPVSLRVVAEYCVRNVPTALTPDGLASALGLPRRTLTRRLTRAGLPPPAALLCWGRLAVAAALLERTPMTVEGVAEAVGFPSAVTLRQCLRRHSRLTPSQLRSPGGLDALTSRFRGSIHPTADSFAA